MSHAPGPRVGSNRDETMDDAKGRDARSPWHMPLAAWKAVAIRTWTESSNDNIGLVAAGVAFYGFLALVPLITAVALCYGIFVTPETVIRHMQALTQVMPPDIARTVGGQLLELVRGSDEKKGLGVFLALGIAIFGARNGAGAILTALNIAYEEQEKRNFLKLNLTSLAMTAAAVCAAILAALAIAALNALSAFAPRASDALLLLGTLLAYALLMLAGAAGAAALYRFGPSRQQAQWIWLTPGSLFAGLMWLLLTLGFGLYVAHVGKFDATYGSLGAVVALLTWLYLSSYILLFGAELNAELEHQTAEDTTVGAPQPIGLRAAWVADHVADEPVAALPAPPERPRLPSPAAPPPEAQGSLVASRLAARIVGLPKVGWISTGLASIGLSMMRKRRHAATGAALIATATGLAWLRARD
ncbi:YihY/virulence factor BrkB family protein [Sphingomonas sp. M1-B02]|uniref:YihY/virulence factor BrkB family protein n=1 Tax=Sphingomonas sp. M1-B02 TaxID=3114300 RepID=UPI0022402BA7|nr:YihY/virulence factor BrkB family protein [Sphingomonas sp. S6-11]UZK65153.1 YihY/virulence factor BrkB family protein [Sphingomonas sp. S6-11]